MIPMNRHLFSGTSNCMRLIQIQIMSLLTQVENSGRVAVANSEMQVSQFVDKIDGDGKLIITIYLSCLHRTLSVLDERCLTFSTICD